MKILWLQQDRLLFFHAVELFKSYESLLNHKDRKGSVQCL